MNYSRDVAIVASLIGLLVLGYAKGKIVDVSPIRSAIEIFVIGGLATAIGIVVGSILAV
jgi:VIT1/CCC1 family predicted Fe2+/Mn2+ transporter